MRWHWLFALPVWNVLALCNDADCESTVLLQKPPEKHDVKEHDASASSTSASSKSPKEQRAVEAGANGATSSTSTAASCANIIEAMGRGINIGNTYDLHQDITDPKVVDEHVQWIKKQGFSHVRLPVTWGERFDPLSTLTKQVTAVVDYALDQGLYVVINTHHEHWLKDHYDGYQQFHSLFWSLWHDIALHFQSRDGHLIFEILNEPEHAFGSWEGGQWPQPFDQIAIDRTRTINGVGYDAVRRVSPTRMIFVSPNAMASIGTASYVYPNAVNLPGGGKDECLGVEVHTYDPWDFAGDTGKNSYFGTVERMKLGLYDVWRNLHIWQFGSGIKLYMGEFGVGRRDCCQGERNSDLVREYYKFAMNHFRSNGWAAAAWDDPGWFAIYHAETDGIHSQLTGHY